MMPRTFICHASEDKDDFVRPFAEGLMSRGVPVWLDEWAIKVGDSIVRRIFDEGLAVADVVVFVLSKTSASKTWVREELDVAVIRRIQDRVRIVPVLIDDVEVPTALLALRWLRADRAAPAAAAEELARALAA